MMIEAKNSSNKFIANNRDSKVISSKILSIFDIKQEQMTYFLKYFSLTTILKQSFNNLKDVSNSLIILINTKREILKTSNWENNNKLSFLEQINEIIDKIREKNRAIKCFDSIKLFSFNNNIKKILDESTNNYDKKDKNDTKQILTETALINKENNFEEVLSHLYNNISRDLLITSNNYTEKQLVNKEFYRIYSISGETTSDIDLETVKSILNTFNTTQNAVLNSVLYQSDYLFENFIRNNLDAYIDFKPELTETNIESKILNYMARILEAEEVEYKNLVKQIIDFGKTVMSNVELLKFAEIFDQKWKNLSDFYEAINISLNNLKRNRKDTQQDSKRALEDVISQDLPNKIIAPIKSFLNESKNLLERFEAEYAVELDNYRTLIEKFQKRLKMNGK